MGFLIRLQSIHNMLAIVQASLLLAVAWWVPLARRSALTEPSVLTDRPSWQREATRDQDTRAPTETPGLLGLRDRQLILLLRRTKNRSQPTRFGPNNRSRMPRISWEPPANKFLVTRWLLLKNKLARIP